MGKAFLGELLDGVDLAGDLGLTGDLDLDRVEIEDDGDEAAALGAEGD